MVALAQQHGTEGLVAVTALEDKHVITGLRRITLAQQARPDQGWLAAVTDANEMQSPPEARYIEAYPGTMILDGLCLSGKKNAEVSLRAQYKGQGMFDRRGGRHGAAHDISRPALLAHRQSKLQLPELSRRGTSWNNAPRQ